MTFRRNLRAQQPRWLAYAPDWDGTDIAHSKSRQAPRASARQHARGALYDRAIEQLMREPDFLAALGRSVAIPRVIEGADGPDGEASWN